MAMYRGRGAIQEALDAYQAARDQRDQSPEQFYAKEGREASIYDPDAYEVGQYEGQPWHPVRGLVGSAKAGLGALSHGVAEMALLPSQLYGLATGLKDADYPPLGALTSPHYDEAMTPGQYAGAWLGALGDASTRVTPNTSALYDESRQRAWRRGASEGQILGAELMSPGPGELGAVSHGVASLLPAFTKGGHAVAPGLVPTGAGASRMASRPLRQPTKALVTPEKTITKVGEEIRGANDAAEALELARTGRHLKQVGASGQYVGAPRGTTTPRDILALRQRYDTIADEGMEAGAKSGEDWYERTRAGITEMSGGRPARMDAASAQLAMTSPQATPDTNLATTLIGANRLAAGQPAGIVRTGRVGRNFDAVESGGDPLGGLSAKTEPYYGHINPNMPEPLTGVNDVHNARAMGFGADDSEELFARGLTKQEHAFMDAEGVLAVERANARALGGRTDWTVGQLQAVIWVRANADAMVKASRGKGGTQFKGLSLEEAISRAWKSYPEHFRKRTAYATYEDIPGAGTGHLPWLQDASDAERMAYSSDPASGWVNEAGQDEWYDAANMYQQNTTEGIGSFTSKSGVSGVPEHNRLRVARPLVGLGKGPEGHVLTDTDQALLDAIESSRAGFDVQELGGFHKDFVYPEQTTMRGTNAIVMDTPGPLSGAQKRGALSAAEGAGFSGDAGFVSDRTHSLMARSFEASGSDLRAFKEDLTTRLQDVIPSLGDVRLARVEGPTYDVVADRLVTDFEAAWKQPQGSGAVVDQILAAFDRPEIPGLMARLDQSTALRARVLAKMQRDALLPGARPDVQNMRRVFEEGGFKALEAARRAGELLPAVALPFLALGLASSLDDQSGAGGDMLSAVDQEPARGGLSQ